jgi:hypothetical protein
VGFGPAVGNFPAGGSGAAVSFFFIVKQDGVLNGDPFLIWAETPKLTSLPDLWRETFNSFKDKGWTPDGPALLTVVSDSQLNESERKVLFMLLGLELKG